MEMETEKQIGKLVNVLHRIARASGYIEWTNPPEDAVRFCVLQYNRILARLRELEPAVATLFTELPETAGPQIIRIAAHELAAYFEEEERSVRRHRHRRHCGNIRVSVGL